MKTSSVNNRHARAIRPAGLVLALAAMGCLITGCSDPTAVACIDKSDELAALCQPWASWALLASSASGCGLNGVYQPATGSVEAGGECQASGRCSFKCTIATDLCPHGVSEITKDEYTCAGAPASPCDAGTTQCVNGLLSECLAGVWSEPAVCADGQICQRTGGAFECAEGVPFSEIQAAAAGHSSSGTNLQAPNAEGSVRTGGTDEPAREPDAPSDSNSDSDPGEEPPG